MVHISGLGRRTDYDAAKISTTTTTMSKETRVCVNEATQREKKQHKCDQLIRSPVKETIELDTEFVCTHARVICVTRHKEKKKLNKKSRKLGVYFPERLCQSFSLSLSLVCRSKYMQQVLWLLACRFCRFLVLLFPCCCFFVERALCSPISRLYNTIVSRKVLLGRERNEYDVSI